MIAAEQKARTTYDNILRLVDDPDVREPIRFLRAREIVHFQRFGEAKRKLTSRKKAHSLRCFAAPIKYKSYDIEHKRYCFNCNAFFLMTNFMRKDFHK